MHPPRGPITRIAPRRQVMPLSVIDLRVMFGEAANYRQEILSFEVVDFLGPCSAIFGRLCYAKFMAVLNYAYLKLKMSGPRGVITMSRNFHNTY